MQKLAKFIVEKRILFFILFAAMAVYCVFGMSRVKVEYSITSFLPQNTDTAKALTIMEDEFVTFGSAKVMIRNISYDKAEELYKQISELDGIKSFAFDNTEDYYKDSCALFTMTFDGNGDDPVSAAAYASAVSMLDGYDFVVPVPLNTDFSELLAREMVLILLLAAAVIFLVLLFTSKSIAEIAVFPIVFLMAALLNMGTNFWLGTISFISNTVCIVLQLALAIDYSIILCHRFTEEKDKVPGDPKGAMINALAKSIPEISSSSLTTISGLVALMFMQLRLGYDLGMVLAKSIICSLLCVFFLMPGIMLYFSKLMDRTRHRSFVPKIRFWGKGVVKIRYILLAVFVGAVATCGVLSQNVDYVYSESAIDTSRPTDVMIAERATEEVFGYDNMFVILVPKGDYEKEREVITLVESDEMISSALGISNIEISDGYYLSDRITYKDLAIIGDVSNDLAKDAFRLYAMVNGDYWAVLYGDKLDTYSVTVIEMLDCLFENDDYLPLDDEQKETFDELKTTLQDGEAQLIGENYSRLVFNIDGAVEGKDTFAMIERLFPQVKEIYPDAIFAGESMSAYDLNESFVSDNLLITLLTIAFIYLILMITFRSWGIPLVLVAVIQGAIFINFAIPVMMGSNLFFFVYLIVSAIQMGATIDYAIVITNRFREIKRTMPKKEAIMETLSQSFPTIFTSGSILTVAALLIGFISTEPLIASIGLCLGRGTIISIFCVMTFLPALLYMLEKPLEKTVFKKRIRQPKPKKKQVFASALSTIEGIRAVLNTSVNGNENRGVGEYLNRGDGQNGEQIGEPQIGGVQASDKITSGTDKQADGGNGRTDGEQIGGVQASDKIASEPHAQASDKITSESNTKTKVRKSKREGKEKTHATDGKGGQRR